MSSHVVRLRKKKKAEPEVVDNDTGVTDDEEENGEEENDPTAGMTEEERILAEILGEVKKPTPKVKKVPLIDAIQAHHWDVIILDEAHRIKGRTTGWTKEIKKLKGSVKHVMTGTGFINNPSEIWSLLNFCSKREYAAYWRFREKYCEEDVINGFRKIVGVSKSRRQSSNS